MSKQMKQRAELMQNLQSMSKQTGLTMVELMIAIVLGLLVTAAALAIFIGGQKSLNMQNGLSSLQQNVIFGLSQVTYGIRHANLDTTLDLLVSPSIRGSGIVFSGNNFPTIGETTDVTAGSFIAAGNFSAENTTSTIANVNSDELVIQFNSKAVRANGATVYTPTIQDCEGNLVPLNKDNANYVTVQRYYVALMPNVQQNNSRDRYALWCDASYYDKDATTNDAWAQGVGVGENPQIILTDVDAFKVRLGVKNQNSGQLRYMGINAYNTLAATSRENTVVSVEIGILARSSDTVGQDSGISASKTFNIAGNTIGLQNTNDNAPKYLREAFNQVIALRNAQGS